MNDKPKNISYTLSAETVKMEHQSPFPLLDALRVKCNTQADVIAHLSQIEKNLKLVSPGVQSAVAEILQKLNLLKHKSNTELMTAAIIAINPSRIIDAANDEKIKIAA